VTLVRYDNVLQFMAANMRDASLYDNASVALYSQLMYGVYTVHFSGFDSGQISAE